MKRSLLKKQHALWRRLNNRFRLTVLDEETLDEVASFQLTKKNVYIALCTLIVVLILFTGILLAITPLKYYIPGYGDIKQRKEYINMNMKMDSLEMLVNAQREYLNSIRDVLNGKTPPEDTSLLKIPLTDTSTY
ncbi:MAG: hypothetical protein EPN39_04200 [Chitinophagaceae bacterium]|nr:MAG: hypothetical protein EPN39_04200 [Chitinophagaceae bacterium]